MESNNKLQIFKDNEKLKDRVSCLENEVDELKEDYKLLEKVIDTQDKIIESNNLKIKELELLVNCKLEKFRIRRI